MVVTAAEQAKGTPPGIRSSRREQPPSVQGATGMRAGGSRVAGSPSRCGCSDSEGRDTTYPPGRCFPGKCPGAVAGSGPGQT